jgi:anti-sigma B factor antagonist
LAQSLQWEGGLNMNIAAESLDGNILKVALEGRMDLQGAQEIDLKFSGYTANKRAVIVDMSAVNFLASMGIRTLLMVAKAVSGRGGKLVLFNPTNNVAKVLETAGVASLIPVFSSWDEARAAVSL